MSENDTVCLCAAGDKPAGVCLEADGTFALVQVSGCVTLPYTGTTAPAAGYNTLAADGTGGVKVVTTGGKEYLVFKVDTTAKTLVGFIQDNAPAGATVVTDEAAGYRGLTSKGFTHHTVNHGAGEYVRHYCIHTNGIESFWALLKRGHYARQPRGARRRWFRDCASRSTTAPAPPLRRGPSLP